MLRNVRGGGAEEQGSDLQGCGALWGPKCVEKTPVDAVYRADSFCCRFLGFRGGQDGAKRWFKVPMEAIYLADPLVVGI